MGKLFNYLEFPNYFELPNPVQFLMRFKKKMSPRKINNFLKELYFPFELSLSLLLICFFNYELFLFNSMIVRFKASFSVSRLRQYYFLRSRDICADRRFFCFFISYVWSTLAVYKHAITGLSILSSSFFLFLALSLFSISLVFLSFLRNSHSLTEFQS